MQQRRGTGHRGRTQGAESGIGGGRRVTNLNVGVQNSGMREGPKSTAESRGGVEGLKALLRGGREKAEAQNWEQSGWSRGVGGSRGRHGNLNGLEGGGRRGDGRAAAGRGKSEGQAGPGWPGRSARRPGRRSPGAGGPLPPLPLRLLHCSRAPGPAVPASPWTPQWGGARPRRPGPRARALTSWAPSAPPWPSGSRQRRRRPRRHVLLLLVQRRLRRRRRRRLRRLGAGRTLPRGLPPPPPPPPPAAPRLSLGAGGRGGEGGRGGNQGEGGPASLARSLPRNGGGGASFLRPPLPRALPLATARAWRGDRCRGITAPEARAARG